MPIDQDLRDLANAYGVATRYEDSERHPVEVGAEAVIAVLALLGVDAATPAGRAEARAVAAERAKHLPPTLVTVAGHARALPAAGHIELEDGSRRDIGASIPADLPPGYHTLHCGGERATLVVAPAALPRAPRAWGWMLQLYAATSRASWGMGDFGDLTAFARAAATQGAGFVLLNPVHAMAPTHPVPASPYYPSSRRFINPLYLRVTDTAEYRDASPELRARVDACAPAEPPDGLIDYDAVWTAKRAALTMLFEASRGIEALEAADNELRTFATYGALADAYGPDWRAWPEPLRDASGPGVAAWQSAHSRPIAFHAWLQTLAQSQLANAGAGLPIGIVHDLAVGIDPGGADAWALAGVLADGAHVGAPPDAFNQLGQDWGLAAWHPRRLAETGYAAYRDLLRRTLAQAGGIRVDHVAGLSRLWWIPPGAGPSGGTYVRYDADAMFGILALEAARAGAVVVGEDLGTVSDTVTTALQNRNMLGSTVLWFARDPGDGTFIDPSGWPENSFASLSTHDLPTAYGFLAGEHVRVRAELDQLARPVADEQADAARERAALLKMLGVPPDASADAIVSRMHAALGASPCRLVGLSPYDVLGELNQPNLPGTVTEYPNWRRPLPVRLDELFDDPRVVAAVAEVRSARACE